MPLLRSYDDSSAATTLRLELKDSEGEIALYSNLGGTIAINHFDGNDYAQAYTSGGSPVALDASNSQAFLQGPGVFDIVKPINVPMAVFVSTEALVSVISES